MDCTTCCGCELEDHDWSKGACKCYIERETGLKPCPFCGGNAILVLECYDDEFDKWYRVECENRCVMQCNSSESEYEAIQTWNRRA